MSVLRQIELACPSCRCRFNSQVADITQSGGGKRTDFHEYSGDVQPLSYQIHMCSHCGFSGAERDFTDQTDISPLVREHVWNELSPHVSFDVPASDKYAAAAKVAAWQGADLRIIGDLWLRAAWCCVDEGDVEAERYYRRFAVRVFTQALASYDSIGREDRAVVTYLVGELWRRIGDLKQANAWFDQVSDEVIDSYTQQWIVEAAKRQQTDPQEWFG